MAKFVNGASSYAAITEIVNGAYFELYIVAPYIKIPQQTKNYIKNVDRRGIKFTIVSRAENNTNKNVVDEDIHFLRELKSAKICVCENLHAKCFLNEKEGLITSMNLHEHSQTHNWEMGIVFTKTDDPAIYNAAINEVQMIVDQSVENPKTKKVIIPPNAESKPRFYSQASVQSVQKPKTAPKKGVFANLIGAVFGEVAYCIRCGEEMGKFALDKPLCNKCYLKWAQFKDSNYKERFCHICGKEKYSISYEKPVCYDCFQQMHQR